MTIDDAPGALQEAEHLVRKYPKSLEAGEVLIVALAANGFEQRAIDAWYDLSFTHPNLLQNRHLLEELSWGILKRELQSTQYGVRLSSLVGAYLTHDARALTFLLKMMRDSNAVVRSVAIQMASSYGDAPLKDELKRLMEEEKIWMVRLSVIQAAGALKIKELTPKLKAIVQSEKSTYEERHLAIAALLNIYEKVAPVELESLAKNSRAGLRHLACSIAAHFEIDEAKQLVLQLIHDPNADVRIAALNAFGLYYRKFTTADQAKEILREPLADSDPAVAITAAWAALLIDADFAAPFMTKWLEDSFAENRRLAAAALATSGAFGADLAVRFLDQSNDPYLKVNLAIGLLGQQREVQRCCDLIFDLLQNEKRKWMMDNHANPLFQTLVLSQIRYVDHIPNYPEAMDQMTRLNLVSLLAMAEDRRATDAMKSFLQKRHWGITGVASAMLLQEGDESSLEIVRELLQDADPDVRLQACLVLAMMGRDESVLHDLQGAYAQGDHERKLHILEALGRIGSVESHSFLIGLLKEPFPILRVAAAAALIQSLNH
ncbi:MAG: HEAT repeat domain-containing protein [Chlamydiia bacterium]|nr:HEAT repeat domain-containing protein [Chlamydiia bacterium]